SLRRQNLRQPGRERTICKIRKSPSIHRLQASRTRGGAVLRIAPAARNQWTDISCRRTLQFSTGRSDPDVTNNVDRGDKERTMSLCAFAPLQLGQLSYYSRILCG